MTKSILLLLTFSVLFINKASSCDCVSSVGYDQAKTVFIGRVVKIVKRGMYEITFKVCQTDKGLIQSKKITVYTPCLIDPCCGIGFKKNEIYKVFAYDRYEKLYTDACTETKKMNK